MMFIHLGEKYKRIRIYIIIKKNLLLQIISVLQKNSFIYNPNEAQGLGDMSLVFIPTGKVTNSFLKYITNRLEKPLKYSNVNKI